MLGRADVVVHDRLSAAELLDLAPDGAERIDVGKAPGRHRLSQTQINDLLVERGRSGSTVVRLKGGDPFVFARGSEEAHALAAAGIAYEVVPGITSALAVPAYGGIPVTQRFSSTSFTVVTGHEDPSSGDGTVDWDAVANTGGTLVILMGVETWPRIAPRLIAAGRDPDTPAAAVRWGTRPQQHTIRATIATLADHPLEAPSVIVVGAVAAEQLDWFEGRPLFGRTVVVTRARAQASAFAHDLRVLGAEVIEAPMIEVVDPSDGGVALRAAVGGLASGDGHYDWVVFTSVNGVARTFAHIPDARALAGVKVAVVGTATEAALAEHRVLADLVPEHFVAESLVEAFAPPPSGGGRVLLSRAEVARSELPDALREMGWEVDDVPAYRTAPATVSEAVAERIADADAVVFMSSSSVANLVEAVGLDRVPATVASIGPVTSGAVRAAGLEVGVQADPHTAPALLAALVDHLGSGNPGRARSGPGSD